MKYMGSKNRHAKELLGIILENRKEGQCYVEPFVGGANVIDKVKGARLACDTNGYLIALLNAMTRGWTPPQISEKEYKHIKENKSDYPPELVGYCGFALSYGGKWFGGWRRDKEGRRDYVKEAETNYAKQQPNLVGIRFMHCSYAELNIPPKSIIYCDPPYANATKYKDDFDHKVFWDWVREKANEGHDVFVSEYNAPDDFECVWEKEVNNSLDKDTGGKTGVEKLYVYKGRH